MKSLNAFVIVLLFHSVCSFGTVEIKMFGSEETIMGDASRLANQLVLIGID